MNHKIFLILTISAILLIFPALSTRAGSGFSQAPNALDDSSPLGSSFVISNQFEEELNPAVAYNSQQQEYLVVWWNDRPGLDDIRAERVSRDGKLLGAVWVAAEVTDRQYPAVTYNSSRNEYLVVWQQYDSVGDVWDIFGQRLSVPSGPGNPQKQGGLITIATGVSFTAICMHPAVAYSSTSDKYLVVFMYGWSAPYKVRGRVLGSDGSLPGSVFDLSSSTSYSQEYPQVAYNRQLNGYLVVWQQKVGDYDIYARIVHPSGTPMGSDAFIISSMPIWEETLPTVTAIPTATPQGVYLVVWQSDNGTDGCIRSQLVTGDGNLTGITPHNVLWYNTGAYAISAVAGNENSRQFLIVLKNNATAIFSAIVTSSNLGEWSHWYGLDSGPGADHPAIASGPSGDFLIAFDRVPFGSREIYGQFWGTRFYLPLVRK